MANAASIVKFCNKGLVETYSKLRVKYICKAWNGIFTNSVTLIVKLQVIKQWLKNTEVKPHLLQSKSFLKVLDIFYQNSNTSLPITLV